MPAGLTVYNTTGTVQIDESYRNLHLVEKRAVTATITTPIERVFVDIAVTGERPIMAIEASNLAPLIYNVNVSGSTWTFRWAFWNTGGGTSETVTAWIFDYVSTPPADTFGLQVFDGSGNTVFHSSSKPLKVVSVQDMATTFTGTSGRKYVPVVCQPSYYTTNVGITVFPHAYSIRCAAANQLAPYDVNFPGGGVLVTPNFGSYAAVDVTFF